MRKILTILVFLTAAFPAERAFAIAVFSRTDSAIVTPATINGAPKQMRGTSGGELYAIGTSTAQLVKISADGNTATTLSYSPALSIHSTADFAMDGNTLYIAIGGAGSFLLYKYNVNGTTAEYIGQATGVSGVTSVTLAPSGRIYNNRGSTLYIYESDLSAASPIASYTLVSAATRSFACPTNLYYVTAAGVLRKVTDYTTGTTGVNGSTDIAMITGLGSGASAPNDLVVPSGEAAVYVSTPSSIRKISSAGTVLWSLSTTNLAAMTVDATGNVSWVDSTGHINVYAPINAPSTFTSSSVSGTSLTLNWTSGVTDSDNGGVTIRRSTSAYPTSPTDGTAVTTANMSSSFNETGLNESTTYYYTLFNKTLDGYYSTGLTLTATTTDITPPDAPVVSADKTALNGNTVNVSWTVPPTTDTFTLQRSQDGGPYVDVQLGIANSTTTYNDSNLSDGTYTYRVYAIDSSSNPSNAGTSSTLTIDTTAPSAPNLLATKNTPNGNTIHLAWDTPSDTQTFTLQRSFNGGGFTSVQTGIPSSTTSLNQPGLADGAYAYQLFAVDAFGNTSNAGASSTLTIDATPPAAPTEVSAEDNGITVTLSWINPIDGDFDSITIRRSTVAFPATVADDDLVASGITNTTAEDAGLAIGVYYYSLFARDTHGNVSAAANVLIHTEGVTPTVVTGDASEVNSTSALLAGSITDAGTSDASEIGFEYGKTTDYDLSVALSGEFTAEDFTLTVEDLDCATTYHYRAFATNDAGTAFGQDGTFTTASCSPTSNLTFKIQPPTTAIKINNDVVFVVTVENPGDEDVKASAVEFTLSDNLQFVSAELIQTQANLTATEKTEKVLVQANANQSVTCTGTNPISCDLGTVPAHASVTLNLTVKPTSAGPISLGVGDDAGTTATASGDNPVAGCSLLHPHARPSLNYRRF